MKKVGHRAGPQFDSAFPLLFRESGDNRRPNQTVVLRGEHIDGVIRCKYWGN